MKSNALQVPDTPKMTPSPPPYGYLNIPLLAIDDDSFVSDHSSNKRSRNEFSSSNPGDEHIAIQEGLAASAGKRSVSLANIAPNS